MRLLSWAGAASIAAAAAAGYGSCEWTHRYATAAKETIPYVVEIAEANDGPSSAARLTEPVEVIDLACLTGTTSVSQFLQTSEPPLATRDPLPGGLRVVNYEIPAAGPDAAQPAPLTLPYFNDDTDDTPAKLPMLGDVPPTETPATLPKGPMFDMVWRFFHGPAEWRTTDTFPLGQPPVSERLLAPEVGPCCEPNAVPATVFGPPKPETKTPAVPRR